MFKLAEAKQLKDKYLLNQNEINLDSYENFEKTAKFSEEIDKSKKQKVYKFLKLKKEIQEVIEEHNKNFEENEVLQDKQQEQLAILVMYFSSTAPSIKIIKKA
jgi:hypothetical protein